MMETSSTQLHNPQAPQPTDIPSSNPSNPEPAHQTTEEPSIANPKPSDVPQPFNQVNIAAMKNKIQKLIKMDNLADITLAGYMIKLLRQKSKMSFRDLHEEVSKCYDVLRRSDGSKYTGDVAKALKGCLTSSQIFKEAGENVWGIREKEAKLYEDKTTKKLKTLISKKKGRGRKKESGQNEAIESDDDVSGSEDDESDDSLDEEKVVPAKKVKTTTAGSYDNVCNMLEKYGNELKGEIAMQSSFGVISESNSVEDVMKSVSKEKMAGILECFEFFGPIIKDYLKSNQGAQPESFGINIKTVGRVKMEATTSGNKANGGSGLRGKKV